MIAQLHFSVSTKSRLALGFALGLLAALPACGDDAEEGSTPGTHADVAAILGVGAQPTSCSISTCHGAATAEAGLELKSGVNLSELLVGVKSCEAPNLNLVEPGEPDKSWLYIKLTAETESNGDLVPDPAWGEPSADCDDAAGFGKRMPRVAPYQKLEAAQLEQVRSWILAGAPGP
jgi:hypothetical protein